MNGNVATFLTVSIFILLLSIGEADTNGFEMVHSEYLFLTHIFALYGSTHETVRLVA